MRLLPIILWVAVAIVLLLPLMRRALARSARPPRSRPDELVLEVGGGTGVVVRDLVALVGRRGEVVGVDSSRLMLQKARALCRESARRTRLALRAADGARLPFAAGRFDAALAITVILH